MENRMMYIVAAASVGSFAAGAGTSYLFFKGRFEKKYMEIADLEITSVKETYAKRYKKDEYVTPETLAKTDEGYDETIAKYQGKIESDGETEPDVEEVAVVEGDFTEDVQVISEEEYFSSDIEGDSFVYYKEDSVLVGSSSQTPVDKDVQDLLDPFLVKFDEIAETEVLYLEIESEGRQLEIAGVEGSYSKNVLGFIEHSEPQRRHKRRWSEDE